MVHLPLLQAIRLLNHILSKKMGHIDMLHAAEEANVLKLSITSRGLDLRNACLSIKVA